VREVDQLQDPVDERVPQRDERVDGPRREADQGNVEEVPGSVDGVLDQPGEQQANEDETENRERRRTVSASDRGGCRGLVGTGFDCYSGDSR
jgi:hypothetical protein